MINVLNDNMFVIAIGQKPVIKNKFHVESQAIINNITIKNTTDLEHINSILRENYNSSISKNAGTSYCNNLYFYILEYIQKHNLNSDIVFIHIPYNKNIKDFEKLTININNLINKIAK